jgi:hypothetical protein
MPGRAGPLVLTSVRYAEALRISTNTYALSHNRPHSVIVAFHILTWTIYICGEGNRKREAFGISDESLYSYWCL